MKKGNFFNGIVLMLFGCASLGIGFTSKWKSEAIKVPIKKNSRNDII